MAKKKTETVRPKPLQMRPNQVDAWMNHAMEMLDRVADQADEESAAKARAALEELR